VSESEARRRNPPIKVWLLPEERELIDRNAREAGLSLSSYLRALGMGERPANVVDLDQVQVLAKVNADLGRLGGLLKLWLSKDARFIAGAPGRGDVQSLLDALRVTQEDLASAVRAILNRF
jgi:hypothetical protein